MTGGEGFQEFPRIYFGDPPLEMEQNSPAADIKQNSTLLKGWQLKSSKKSFVPFWGGVLPRARKGSQTQNYRYPPDGLVVKDQ